MKVYGFHAKDFCVTPTQSSTHQFTPKALLKIIIKCTLIMCLIVILRSVSNLYNTLKIFIIQVLKILETLSIITVKYVNVFNNYSKKCF